MEVLVAAPFQTQQEIQQVIEPWLVAVAWNLKPRVASRKLAVVEVMRLLSLNVSEAPGCLEPEGMKEEAHEVWAAE
jgi:hypothetical protein